MRTLNLLSISLILFASMGSAQARPLSTRIELVRNPTTEMVVAVPTRGPLKPIRMDMSGVHFAGRVKVSGTYVYGYDSSYVSDGWVQEPDLHFMPDKSSRALLPYSKEDGPVHGLHFSNADVFLAAALSRATIAKVNARKIKSVSGRVTIWVDKYVASVSCGTAAYTARFLRIDSPRQVIASNKMAQPIGCG